MLYNSSLSMPPTLFSVAGAQLERRETAQKQPSGSSLPSVCRLKSDLNVDSLASSLCYVLKVTYGHHISIHNLIQSKVPITVLNEESAVSDASFMSTYSRKETLPNTSY
jgi:hypothetical protein